MEVLQFIKFFLSASWDFFTEVNVPGFDFSIGALFVGLFLGSLGLRFVFMMVGVHASSGDISFLARHRGTSERGLSVRDEDR